MSRRARRSGRRHQRADDRLTGVVVAVVLTVALAVAVVKWLLAHGWVLAVIGALAVLAGGAWVRRRQQQAQWEAVRGQGLWYGLPQLDALHHARFEEAVRDLMRRDGCQNAARVGDGGDLGADVKATDPYGRHWVIQCEHRRAGLAGAAVGTPDPQVLNGTARPVHGADVAVIVTHGRVTAPAVTFARQQRLHVVDREADVAVIVTHGRVTAPAVTFARQQRLHVVDRHTLGVWASGSRPLWELLRAVPPPRKPTPLS